MENPTEVQAVDNESEKDYISISDNLKVFEDKNEEENGVGSNVENCFEEKTDQQEQQQQQQKQQNKGPEILIEGQAKIIVAKKDIFYNPVQEFNRDLSIVVLNRYSKDFIEKNLEKKTVTFKEGSQKGLRILEAMSGTGLRSIRYAKEVPGVHSIIANDINAKAAQSIRKNIRHNEIDNIVSPHNDDATMLMYQNRLTRFDVVDLDPYGCPTMFLDGAVQCIKNNGLLLVTATDMAVLAGNAPETCYTKYGAISLKSKFCHEMALRILLQSIASHAARYGRVMTPLLSISADFYIRVFVKIHTSQIGCKDNTIKTGYIYQCNGCESMTIQPLGILNDQNKYRLPQVPSVDKLCAICKHKHHMGGPIWIGPLHDKDFVRKILADIESEENNNLKSLYTLKRIHGILHVICEELEEPLYYQIDRLTSIVRCIVPPMVKFRSALLNAGYKVSYSHAHKNSIKTDAPNEVIWDIIKAWEKINPANRDNFPQGSAGLTILNSPSKIEVSFNDHKDAVPFSQRNKMIRFQMNPSPHWGPGTKSTTMTEDERAALNKRKNEKRKRAKENRRRQAELERAKKPRMGTNGGTEESKEENIT